MMKLNCHKIVLTFLVLTLFIADASAQGRKKTTAPKKKAAKSTTSKITNTQSADSNLNVVLADTAIKPTSVVAAPLKDPFPLDTIAPSQRLDAAIARDGVKEKKPLEYEHISEDDAFYRERVWREIDIREKLNTPFRYKANEDNGNQRFINILLTAIKKGDVDAFDAIDDRFTTKLSVAEVAKKIVGRADTIRIPDWENPGREKDSVVPRAFNPDEIVKFWIKEEWIFDKESSKMYVRILGIAPIKAYKDENTQEVLDESPIFWIYYPDLRSKLALYEVYNGKNFGARISWEELFELRLFSSTIIKTTIENPNDKFIKDYISDNILRLLEGENLKNKIFNFEQSLWSY